MKNIRTFSKREKEIMDILWNSNKALTASEIISYNQELKMPTVQAVLKKLLTSNIIEIAEIVYSGNVLSRTYRPCISADEYVNVQYKNLSKSLSPVNLFSSLLGSTNPSIEEIEEIEKLIAEYKRR